MGKSELRSSITSDVSFFLSTGGRVIHIKAKTVRRRNAASGKQKLRLGWHAPINRPSNSWDLLP